LGSGFVVGLGWEVGFGFGFGSGFPMPFPVPCPLPLLEVFAGEMAPEEVPSTPAWALTEVAAWLPCSLAPWPVDVAADETAVGVGFVGDFAAPPAEVFPWPPEESLGCEDGESDGASRPAEEPSVAAGCPSGPRCTRPMAVMPATPTTAAVAALAAT
jgi:hypothetical protein